jgi:hypothetical protein
MPHPGRLGNTKAAQGAGQAGKDPGTLDAHKIPIEARDLYRICGDTRLVVDLVSQIAEVAQGFSELA